MLSEDKLGHMGPKQSQDEKPKPHIEPKLKQQQQCWAKKQQQQEFIYGGSVLSRAQWKHQEIM